MKKILDPTRIRQTHNGFGFIPHRFLRDGFLSSLDRIETQLYLFYVLAADRYGLSFYSEHRMGELLNLSQGQLRNARNGLLDKELICCEESICQVLELPPHPLSPAVPEASFDELKHRIGGAQPCQR
jgi:hypothetical protein